MNSSTPETPTAGQRPATTADNGAIAVRIEGLTKRFGEFCAVDHLSLDIGQGETVALLGPYGAGKTTTISMLLGLLPPDSDSVSVRRCCWGCCGSARSRSRCLAIAIGYSLGAEVAFGALYGLYLALSALGGLWMPLSIMPSGMQTIAKLLPSYRAASTGWRLISDKPFDFADALFLVAWAVVFALIALFFASRRANSR